METKDKKEVKEQFNSLIIGMSKGEKSAFDNFHAVYGKLIYSFAVSASQSSFLADEIVDDVLFRIWQLSPTIKSVKCPISWLYKVTANCAKDRIKSEKEFFEIYDVPQEDKNFEGVLIKEAFFSHISTLNEEEQLIIILYYVQDLTFESIAKELKKPTSTVSSTFYRAIEKLKQISKKF